MIPVWEYIVIDVPTLTLPSNVEIPVTKRSLNDPAAPTTDTPLVPVYLAPEIYTLLPVKLTPLGRLSPMKFRVPA